MTSIIHMAAMLFPAGSRSHKNSGTPTSAPAVKQTSCLRAVSYTHLDVYKRQAEDQLALASGITGIYHLRHIRGVHQLFENIKLFLFILSLIHI